MNSPYIYFGNANRFHSLFEKATRKEPLSLVFLGASVTMGYQIETQHHFIHAIQQYFQHQYGCSDIAIHNLSSPGMPSLHGLFVSFTELEKKQPDFILIDYSVNDQKIPIHRDAYESLLVRCLSLPGNPAVASLCLQSSSGYTCTPQISAISKHYDIPYIDVGNWLKEDIKNGRLKWENYSYDDRHPGPFGHTYIGKCITTFLDEIAKTECNHKPYILPESPFFHRTLADVKPLVTNWSSEYLSSGDGLVLWEGTLLCRSLFAVYEVHTAETFGKLECIIDGSCHILDSFHIHLWHHDHPEAIHLSRNKEEHTIRLQISEKESKKYFHLLYFGADF